MNARKRVRNNNRTANKKKSNPNGTRSLELVSRPTVAPLGRRGPRNRASGSIPKVAMRGSDILGIINVTANTQPGQTLFRTVLNPLALVDTRLHQVSKLYSRWRPISLVATVIGSGSATTFGSVAIGWTPDPDTVVSGNDKQNVMRVMACRPSRMARLNQTVSLSIPPQTSRKWYMMKGQPDDADHGSIAVVCSAATGGYTGATTFSVQLVWNIEFEGAELETVSSDEYITPDVGYENLFTTSDGSYNSEVLTLKMHHGGSMVPFSSANPAKIYTSAPGTTVTYYAEDKTTLRAASYFTVVQGYSIPGFVMFASRDDAATYIRTGDVAKCLKYYTQGPVIAPARPQFQLSESVFLESERQKMADKIYRLESMLKALPEPMTKTRDSSSLTQLKKQTDKLLSMPDGTTTSPFKVISEDPVAQVRTDYDMLEDA